MGGSSPGGRMCSGRPGAPWGLGIRRALGWAGLLAALWLVSGQALGQAHAPDEAASVDDNPASPPAADTGESAGSGQERPDRKTRDPEDNWFDLSRFLDEVYGFVPVLSVITEPALGNAGGMLALLFFGERKEDQKVPPNMYGVAGGYTANNSWFTGGYYRGFHDGGRWRTQAFAFYAEPNLDLYYQTERLGELSARARIQSYGAGGMALRRLGAWPVYVGARVSDKQIAMTFKGPSFGDAVSFPDLELRQNHLRAHAVVEVDTQDNVFSPTEGSYLHLEGGYNRVFGDRPGDFARLDVAAHQFWDLGPVVLGFRGVSYNAFGAVPFYLRPTVSMRGVPAARYQGDTAFLLETEEMIRLTRRFSLVVFGGWGKAISDDVRFTSAPNAWSVGTGFRYLIARLYGLQMGIDIARGPEQFAWYVQFGHAWNAD